MAYKNKEKQKEALRLHYETNKESYRKRDKERFEKTKAWVKGYKQKRACVICGESRWQCLDFHHIDPASKFKSIFEMVKGRFSISKIQEEINKCEVICANCHRIKHIPDY